MDSSDLIWTSAAEQARALRAGTVTSVELVESVLARIGDVDGQVGAFLAVDRDRSLSEAGRADEALTPGAPVGALHGVPISVKDLIPTAGMTTTYGSALLRDYVPTDDAPAVARLRASGAIVFGKTNTSEFGLGGETWTTFGPRCNNPWHLDRTTGGSSGGAGAAVAAGMGSAALGTDAGGSIRLPGAFCGVAGLKPTFGRVPSARGLRASDHQVETTGPMARTIEDLALILDVIAGHDRHDVNSSTRSVPSHSDALLEADDLVIDWPRGAGLGAVDSSIDTALRRVVEALSSGGAAVRESRLEIGDLHPFLAMRTLVGSAVAGRVVELVTDRMDELTSYAREFVSFGLSQRAVDYTAALYQSKQLRQIVDDALEGRDAILLPTMAVSAWPHGEPPSTGVDEPVPFPFLALANLTGHPAVTVPIGRDPDGLPIGLQLIGHQFGEATLLRAAAAVEAVVEPLGRPLI